MSMTVIQHTELTGTQAAIEFTSISNGFTDLCLILSARSSQTYSNLGAVAKIGFNTYATNPTNRALRGQGSSGVGSFTNNQFVVNPSDSTSNTFGNATIYIPNYTSSVAKSFSIDSVYEDNNSFAEQQINAQLWNVSDAITSIKITLGGGNFVQYSSATLYGILKGSNGGVTVS